MSQDNLNNQDTHGIDDSLNNQDNQDTQDTHDINDSLNNQDNQDIDDSLNIRDNQDNQDNQDNHEIDDIQDMLRDCKNNPELLDTFLKSNPEYEPNINDPNFLELEHDEEEDVKHFFNYSSDNISSATIHFACLINNITIHPHINTQLGCSIISQVLLEELRLNPKVDTNYSGILFYNGRNIKILGKISKLEIEIEYKIYQFDFMVTMEPECTIEIGLENFHYYNAKIDFQNREIVFSNFTTPIIYKVTEDKFQNSRLLVDKTKLNKLCELGFVREDATHSLFLCNGNFEDAINQLLTNS